ncbi:hypothetical protein TNCV_717021 [Trichonephila clavipes]|nr:hypothetical protein TNCV_717021 [Trichonephila clavipes]
MERVRLQIERKPYNKASLPSSSGRRVRFRGGQKGVALQLQDARVGVGSNKRCRLDVDVRRSDVTAKRFRLDVDVRRSDVTAKRCRLDVDVRRSDVYNTLCKVMTSAFTKTLVVFVLANGK